MLTIVGLIIIYVFIKGWMADERAHKEFEERIEDMRRTMVDREMKRVDTIPQVHSDVCLCIKCKPLV